ncbi:unnamed protein product [Nippostrongylus brasiliensis]|uniref:Transposase n=1 Tax=Nippostrongylus brasiliensis TaxID=27835 RepID=A0A0N4XVA3_NIPBR|nr:unnamed protein product [Nippostrongylus brasiliensis]
MADVTVVFDNSKADRVMVRVMSMGLVMKSEATERVSTRGGCHLLTSCYTNVTGSSQIVLIGRRQVVIVSGRGCRCHRPAGCTAYTGAPRIDDWTMKISGKRRSDQ